MKKRLKEWARKCFFGVMNRLSFQHYDPRCSPVRELVVSPSALSCFSLSANIIKLIRTEQGVLYFREMICRSPLPEYLDHLLEDYLLLLRNERIMDNFTQALPIEIQFPPDVREQFEAYIRNCRLSRDFYAKLSCLIEVQQREGYSVWNPETQLTPEMVAECGFPGCPASVMRVFPDFFSFMTSGLERYRHSALAGPGGMDSAAACRSVATKLVADALGVSRLIPDTEVVLLKAGAQQMYGVICSRCPGMRAKDALWNPAPLLQRDLADLQMLDALCYQKDHWVNNYNVYEKGGLAVGAMAFDNDSFWSFAPFPSISFTFAFGGDPLVNASGLITLPHFSAVTAQYILKCDVRKLCEMLRPYLNRLQLFALRMRLRALQRALQRTMAARADFLLADDAWTEQTLQEELSGAHGRTYTYLYATTRDCCASENGAPKV